MKRGQIINREIQKNGYSSYLEIGVNAGGNFRQIRVKHKVGVDPDPKSKLTTHYMTSDDFFKENKETFDIIFIDGLHEYKQVYKDILNSLEVLNEGGTIILHDLNPTKEIIQKVPRESGEWTGDCWKAMVDFRKLNKCLTYTIDTDYGIGVIKPNKPNTVEFNTDLDYTYANLDKNRVDWLGLISVADYLKD